MNIRRVQLPFETVWVHLNLDQASVLHMLVMNTIRSGTSSYVSDDGEHLDLQELADHLAQQDKA